MSKIQKKKLSYYKRKSYPNYSRRMRDPENLNGRQCAQDPQLVGLILDIFTFSKKVPPRFVTYLSKVPKIATYMRAVSLSPELPSKKVKSFKN
jgi:hypothetical protein